MIPVNTDSKLLRVLLCATLIINIVLTGVFVASPAKGHCSGIEGKVLKYSESQSPDGSTETVEAYPRASFIILDAETKALVTRGTTDENGCFNVRLEPNRYIILLEGISDGRNINMAPVRVVKAGRLTEVTIYAGHQPFESSLPGILPLDFA
jgi:hypothetical protein